MEEKLAGGIWEGGVFGSIRASKKERKEEKR